jgi:D-sedoheptulose 7-phosphate isomerase
MSDVIKYLKKLRDVIDWGFDADNIECLRDVLLEAYHNGNDVFIFGNGGSASTASHAAVDWMKGATGDKEKSLRVHCLNDSIPIITALANDVDYDMIFAEQLKYQMKPNDLVIGISGSGNSKNIVFALTYANEHGGKTFSICGYDGGLIKGIAKHNIHVAVNDMQIVEDCHMIIVHCIMRCLMERLK